MTPAKRTLWLLALSLALTGCTLPEPPPRNLPTLPAVLEITPAPTLDIDATATALSSPLRPSPTVAALYVVQAGDTLSGIAERFETTVDDLVAANNLTDPNSLQPGQALLIPSMLRTPIAETSTPTSAAVVPTPTLGGTVTPTLQTP